MKVMVATNKIQGVRKNDFCWTEEGELVHFAFECDGETVDGVCGCRLDANSWCFVGWAAS